MCINELQLRRIIKEELNEKMKPVVAIMVFSPEEAERLGRSIPNSVIVGKVRQHIKETGTSGLAGDILNQS